MKQKSDAIAVIVAAGRGLRFGAELPKQFCALGGRPMVMTTIERFAEVVDSKNIILVIDPSMRPLWRRLCDDYGFESPRLVDGGDSRAESVANAIASLGEEDDRIVMIHDGARPLVSAKLLRRMSALPDGYSGAVPVAPVTDTLREKISGDNSVTVDRSRYAAVQTPQTFTLGILRRAYGKDADISSFTDDASAVEQQGLGKIALIEGEKSNIKVTSPEDMAIAETLMQLYIENSRR